MINGAPSFCVGHYFWNRVFINHLAFHPMKQYIWHLKISDSCQYGNCNTTLRKSKIEKQKKTLFWVVFSLAGRFRRIHTSFLCLCYSGYCSCIKISLYGIMTLFDYILQCILANFISIYAVLQPRRHISASLVWAIPCSLATTYGITFVFCSYRYLAFYRSLGLHSFRSLRSPTLIWV